MSAGQPADVVVGLDLRGDADLAARLDHVRVERPLDEEADVPEPAGLVLEDPDELLADDPPLLLGLRDPGEPGEEALACVDMDERDVEVRPERLDDLLGLVLAQEAVVDEHAGQLVADRLVHEQRRDRGVDAAGEPADDLLGADLRADALDLLLDHRGGRPGGRRAGDLVEEALEHPLPLRRVHDLGVELDGVEAALGVLEGRDRRRLRRGRDRRARWRGRHRVAVAHPDDLIRLEVTEQRARRLELDVGLAELRDLVRLDSPAELAGHQLHPVADAQRRHAELEDRWVGERGALGVDRGGAAREDERQRPPRADLLGAQPVRDELGVDARLAHPPGDQLAVLAPEVQDEHRALLGGGLGRKRCRRQAEAVHRRTFKLSLGDSSARPS